MNTAAFSLYLAAGTVDSLGLVLAAVDIRKRIARLREYFAPRPPPTPLPLSWNEDLTTIQILLAAQEPIMIEAQVRRALNELNEVIRSERQARLEAEARIAALAGAGERLWRLAWGAGLVIAGTLLGVAGNLAGSAGH